MTMCVKEEGTAACYSLRSGNRGGHVHVPPIAQKGAADVYSTGKFAPAIAPCIIFPPKYPFIHDVIPKEMVYAS